METKLAGSMRTDTEARVGRGVSLRHGGSFPLLLVLFDAQSIISLQVHPMERDVRGR